MKSLYLSAVMAVICGLVCGAILLAPHTARAESFLNYLMPGIFGAPDEGPRPEDTLQAPFSTEKPKPTTKEQAGLMNMYDKQGADGKEGLDKPHRSAEQIGEWITGIATQALTIDPKIFAEESKKYTGWFMPYALQEYNTYLTANQTLDVLKSNNMRLTAFAESKPVLVQEGVLEGTYRWLFRVPVMLTYYEVSTVSLKGKKPSSQTQRVMVNVQVGRVPITQHAEGMAVERWSVANQ